MVNEEVTTSEEVSSTERSDADLDAIADRVEGGHGTNRSMAMSEESAAPGVPSPSEARSPAPPPNDKFLEFVHNGKPIKAPFDQVIKWAQQGYDYPQKLQKLNQERKAFDEQMSVYRQIDQWAQTNQDKWKQFEQHWNQFQTGQLPASSQQQQAGDSDPYASRFQALETQLSQMKQFADTMKAERDSTLAEKDDQALNEAIQSIREKHKDLDWDRTDDNGKSMEMRILEHAAEYGMKDGAKAFGLAFKDLLHDQLLQRKATEAKLAVAKGIQARTKLGVLGETPTPGAKRSFEPTKDIRNRSYEDIEKEIVAELRGAS